MGFLRKRFSEASTWAGIGTIIANAATAYATGGASAAGAAVLLGLVAVLVPEKGAAAH